MKIFFLYLLVIVGDSYAAIKIPIGFSNSLGTNIKLLSNLHETILPWNKKENKA